MENRLRLGPEWLRTIEGFWHERLWLMPVSLSCLSTGQTAVIDVAALRIGEDLRGFDDVLKGRRALRPYPIWMISLGQGAERVLDTTGCGSRGYSQNAVVVFVYHGYPSSALLMCIVWGELAVQPRGWRQMGKRSHDKRRCEVVAGVTGTAQSTKHDSVMDGCNVLCPSGAACRRPMEAQTGCMAGDSITRGSAYRHRGTRDTHATSANPLAPSSYAPDTLPECVVLPDLSIPV